MNTGTRKAAGRGAALLVAGLATFALSGVVATPAQAAIISGRCEYTSSQPEVYRGSAGTAVRQVQCELNYAMRNTNLDEDGDFGGLTDAAVRKFQRCVGIGVDGRVGPITWSHLNRWAAEPTAYAC
ncbi:peptidoglycan-binding domain-containing protein [Catenuloplanes japonicus]|uniref:peptidoglycan-binding domain-containing protein n=1 Tax=Catenuloplanes japonicus TaxID=33876 RepID=UPI00068BDE4C|nr:peptidoglycan-binding domain-containing protein [Catenuloplanes japonicus]